jgi:chemotaxis protein CheZ
MSTTRRPFTAERRRPGTPAAGAAGHAPGPVGEETSAILAAIAGLSDRLSGVESRLDAVTPKKPEPEELPEDLRRQIEEARFMRTEIIALARSIEDTKVEIAKLRDQRPEGDRLTDMAHELDAIVDATEGATNGILDITETITTLVSEIQAHNSDGYVRQLADDIQENLLSVFEHCNFQDLTGQRISKVVNAMKFIEDRLDRMMDIWGREDFETAASRARTDDSARARDDRDSHLLNGPQTKEKGISQDEIDALFD